MAEEVKPIEQAIKEVQQSQPASGPVEVTLDDGTVVKAGNWQEAFQAVSKMKVDTSTALRDREKQIRDMQATHQPAAPVVQAPAAGFDQKHYWEMMGQDPLGAQNYLDQHRFGLESPEQVPQVFQSMHNTSVKTGDAFEVQSFISRNPDWPATDAATDYVMQTLQNEGRPVNAENLEYIYLRAVRDGVIEPLAQEQTGTFIPPSLSGSGASPAGPMGSLDNFASLTADQQQEVLKKAGLYQ